MRRGWTIASLMGAVLLLTTVAPAGAGSYGTELPFVLGSDARVSGLGGLGTSFGRGASVQYYNPSALSFVEWREFVFFRSTLFDSKSTYHSLSYAQPLLRHGTLAVTVMRVDVGGVEERDDTNRLLSSDLHDSQTRVLLGYGRTIGSNFATGLNVKIDNQSFGSYSGSGVGLDLGFSANQSLSGHSFIKGFRQGLVIQNVVEPSLKLNQDKVSDPASIALGLSIFSGTGNLGMVTTLDLSNPRFSPATVHFGQEVTYLNNYSLRFGMDATTPTFGFGARYKSMALDYAYRSQDFGNSHRISLAVRFGASTSERQATARHQQETELNDKISHRMGELEHAQIDRALDKGRSLLAEHDYDAALENFEIALLWDPDNPTAKELEAQCRYQQALALGEEAIEQGAYLDAMIHLKKALNIVPGDSTASALVQVCDRNIAAARNSNILVGRLLKTAIDLYAERRFTDALSGFDEVLKVAPTNGIAREYQEKCVANINSIVQRLKTDAAAQATRGDYDSAIRFLEDALRYKNNDPALLATISKYESRKEAAIVADAAERQTQTKTDLPPAPVVNERLLERKYNEGMKAFNDGRFDMAIQSLKEVWSQQPDFHNVTPLLTKAYLFVGMNYYSDQNYTDAINIWEQALRIDPNNNKAKRYLAKASEEARKLREDYSGN